KVRELVLEVLREGTPIHPYGVYKEIRDRHHRGAYPTCRRIIRELLEEGRVRRLSVKEVEDLGLQVTSSPSGRSGWRPPIPRSYYQIK
ncbi:unnamed protein product, partial [marine sediment metagenome]